MADEKSEGNENGVGGNTGDGGGWKILRYLVLPKMPPELGIESIPIHNRVLVRALVYAPPTRPSLRRTDGARGNVESPLVSSISMRTFDLRELIKPHHFGLPIKLRIY
jgi:hypothetical protein